MLIFGKKIIWVICVYTPQSGKPDIQKEKFYDELVHEWNMKGRKKLILMVMLEKRWMDLRVYMGEMELGSKIWKAEYCWNSMIRRIYVQTYALKKNRKGR